MHEHKCLIPQFCNEREAIDKGISPQCKLCSAPVESTEHVLTQCRGTAEIADRLLPEMLNTVLSIQPGCAILNNHEPYLTQLVLDCISLNPPEPYIIPGHHPHVSEIFRISRHWCYAISRARLKLLK